MSLVCAAAVSATVYKWVDENGVTHYSDQPHENAEKVQVAAPQTYPAPRTAQGQPTAAASAQAANAYQSCVVTAPQNDQTLPNAFTVSTMVQVSPQPHDGDQVSLLLDGQRLPDYPTTGGGYTIPAIDRGMHSLQAIVQDNSGRVLCSSPAVTFTVLQPSVLNPANPNFKR
ncbi:MAG: DUF4124 domain-containing protein [Steroidobacteraceae bacterium]